MHKQLARNHRNRIWHRGRSRPKSPKWEFLQNVRVKWQEGRWKDRARSGTETGRWGVRDKHLEGRLATVLTPMGMQRRNFSRKRPYSWGQKAIQLRAESISKERRVACRRSHCQPTKPASAVLPASSSEKSTNPFSSPSSVTTDRQSSKIICSLHLPTLVVYLWWIPCIKS